MRDVGGDWLDRIARRSAGGVPSAVRESERATDLTDERFSRATAVKLAVAGTASLALGAWGAPARADEGDFGQCLQDCFGGNDRILKEQERACLDVFAPKSFFLAPGWRKFRELFRAGAFSAWKDLVTSSLAGACVMQQQADAKNENDKCLPYCKQRCGQRALRATQGIAASRQVCEPPPPPPPETPKPPPPPNASENPCWACVAGSPDAICCICPGTDSADCAISKELCGQGC